MGHEWLALTKPTAPRRPFNGAVRLTARLMDAAGEGIEGKTIVLERKSGTSWVAAYTAVTDDQGYARLNASALKYRQTYRARFAESAPYHQAAAASVVLTPKARLSRSTSWRTLRVKKTYYAKGFVEPYHATTDGNKVKVLAYKKGRNGHYGYVRSFTARYSYYSKSKTRYKAAVKLPSKGRWLLITSRGRLRATPRRTASLDYVVVK